MSGKEREMKTMRTGIVVMIALAAGPWVMCQDESPGQLAPDVWVSAGDSDGDGLKDDFELRQGLDPHQAISFADGSLDEDRIASSGKTMWDVQSSEAPASPPEGGGGGCGLLGLEALAIAALLRRKRGL